MMGGSLLHIRHPGLGWLHFVLLKESAAALGRLLLAQAELPVPTASPGKMN